MIVDELFFRTIFSLLYGTLILCLAPARFRGGKWHGFGLKDRSVKYLVALIIFAPLWWSGMVLYILLPNSIILLSIPLPAWFRLIMAGVASSVMPFLIWAFRTIGKNWVHALEPSQFMKRTDNVLVTNGPYRYVRHPLYASALTLVISLALVASNWLLLLPAIAFVGLICTQIPKEEEMLANRFGDEYRKYMESTPRFVPKLKWTVLE